MSGPSVAASVWLWAAVDPVLIAIAVVLGWRANQAGKIFIAAIAALGITLVTDAVLTAIGLPGPAPLSRDVPMLLPVRAVAAFIWAAAAYGARQVIRRRST